MQQFKPRDRHERGLVMSRAQRGNTGRGAGRYRVVDRRGGGLGCVAVCGGARRRAA